MMVTFMANGIYWAIENGINVIRTFRRNLLPVFIGVVNVFTIAKVLGSPSDTNTLGRCERPILTQ